MTEAFHGNNERNPLEGELADIEAQAALGVELDRNVADARSALQQGGVDRTNLDDFFAQRSAFGAAVAIQRAWDAPAGSEADPTPPDDSH